MHAGVTLPSVNFPAFTCRMTSQKTQQQENKLYENKYSWTSLQGNIFMPSLWRILRLKFRSLFSEKSIQHINASPKTAKTLIHIRILLGPRINGAKKKKREPDTGLTRMPAYPPATSQLMFTKHSEPTSPWQLREHNAWAAGPDLPNTLWPFSLSHETHFILKLC